MAYHRRGDRADSSPRRDLTAARGALDVGLVVTVTPKRPLDPRVTKDGGGRRRVNQHAAGDRSQRRSGPRDRQCRDRARPRRPARAAGGGWRGLERQWREGVVPLLAAARAARCRRARCQGCGRSRSGREPQGERTPSCNLSNVKSLHLRVRRRHCAKPRVARRPATAALGDVKLKHACRWDKGLGRGSNRLTAQATPEGSEEPLDGARRFQARRRAHPRGGAWPPGSSCG